MDTYYARLDLPFRQALAVWATVISVSAKWMVCDAGLKSLGMDHGDPSIDAAKVWFCSDEHTTFAPEADGPLAGLRVGDRVQGHAGACRSDDGTARSCAHHAR